jgi:hypothetical protein
MLVHPFVDLSPKEIPSKVQFAGREYNCGPDPRPADHDTAGLTEQGRTVGWAEILALVACSPYGLLSELGERKAVSHGIHICAYQNANGRN